MIRGINVQIGGKMYLMPPANFNTLDRHDDFLQRSMAAASNPEAFVTAKGDFREMFAIVHEALKRNYPELTGEQLGEHVDMGNILELFQAALRNSGFVEKEASPGE